MRTLALACLVTAVTPITALAQVTQTYTYDGNGRLTGVTTTGAGGTNTASYAYDDADNRTSRIQIGTSAYAALLSLPADNTLLPGQALVSQDHRYSLAIRESGRLELWEDQSPVEGAGRIDEVFASNGRMGAKFIPVLARPVALRLTNDGDLTADADNVVLWSLSSLSAAGGSQ